MVLFYNLSFPKIKNDNEKNRFFGLLNDHLDSFPPDICKSVIVNQLSAALEFNSSGSAVLGPLLKVCKSLIKMVSNKTIDIFPVDWPFVNRRRISEKNHPLCC